VTKNFYPLKSGEVICVANPVQFVSPHNTFRVSELAEALKQELIKYSSYGVTEEDLGWLSPEGSDCAILRFGSPGWQKGRLRLKIEFCPDESEENDNFELESDATHNYSDNQKQVLSTNSSSSNKNVFENSISFDSESDDFSVDPELDFIAETATVLELNKPSGNIANLSNKQNEEIVDLDADMLSQSIEDELKLGQEEVDPFGDDEKLEFSESLDDDDNFGFGELGLGDEEKNDENSDFDTVWQDL
jgi:pilus assembly protein FimV